MIGLKVNSLSVYNHPVFGFFVENKLCNVIFD